MLFSEETPEMFLCEILFLFCIHTAGMGEDWRFKYGLYRVCWDMSISRRNIYFCEAKMFAVL